MPLLKRSWTASIFLAIGFLSLACPFPTAAATRSPVGFSAGEYAGDLVFEKSHNRVWYIDPVQSRRYQLTSSSTLEQLKAIAQPFSWAEISSVPDEKDKVSIPLKQRIGISGLVYDPNAPDLIWHIRKRAYVRHALRTDADIAAYLKNAMSVSPASLDEYPIAKADYDYALAKADPKIPANGKFISVNLKEQRLRAYEDGKLVRTFLVSTGSYRFPTPPGDYSVLEKDPLVNYKWSYGKGHPDNYDLGTVPYNLLFRPHMYIHYAYWHNGFGTRRSHGCINVSLQNIKWIYRWADVGVPVKVQ